MFAPLSALQRTKFMYLTSILKIFSGHYLSPYDMKKYVNKHLTRTLISGLSLSLSLLMTYETDEQNINSPIHSGQFLTRLKKNIYNQTLNTNNIFGALSLSQSFLKRYKFHVQNLNTLNIFVHFSHSFIHSYIILSDDMSKPPLK